MPRRDSALGEGVEEAGDDVKKVPSLRGDRGGGKSLTAKVREKKGSAAERSGEPSVSSN